MVAVFKKAELPFDVLDDPEALERAVQWALRGLIRRCEDCMVDPVGTLTVVDRTVEDEAGPVGPVRSYELRLDLAVDPVYATVPAVGVRCPVLDCGQIEFGRASDAGEVTARAAKHWEIVHSAGDQFA